MKKHGKAYWGMILSFILAFSIPFSTVTAAEEGMDLLIDEAEITEPNEDENGAVHVLDDTPNGGEGSDDTDGDQDGSDGDDEPDTVTVNSLTLNKSSVTLKVKGQTVALKVTFDPENATNQDINWKSSNTSVATVKNGTVTAVDGGTATITATSADNTKASATCKVTVSLYSDGFHQDPDSSDWYYYTNGKVAASKTDVIKGTVNGTSGWWNVVKGKVTKGETVAKNSNGWWYINSNGKVDFSYTGFAKNSNGWWYLESGKVNFNKNSVIKDTKKKIDGKQSWWYVVGSKVQTNFTGLADYKNSNGWWYIKNGQVDFSHNGVDKNKNGWWYVLGGKVQFGFTGLANYKNSNGWWYIKNGKVDFSHNGVDKNKNGWWYVLGGKVQFGFTGLADYKNSNGWWYINNGKVTFDQNTVAKNKNGWYYVKNSKVDFSYTGIAENQNGWWYIKSGKVDFSAGDYSFAKNTSQIIDVKASGSTGTLTLYNKNGNTFTKKLSTSCYVGENGIASPANKKEGDKKTPTGVYTLGQAFGIASDPGCTRDYLKLNSNYYWVNDSTSKYYNQLVDITKTGLAWKSAEHLINYTTAYKYAIAIDYNTSCTPNKGSAYFLHCSRGKPTAGCVAVSETNMVKILQSLKTDTRIYIH